MIVALDARSDRNSVTLNVGIYNNIASGFLQLHYIKSSYKRKEPALLTFDPGHPPFSERTTALVTCRHWHTRTLSVWQLAEHRQLLFQSDGWRLTTFTCVLFKANLPVRKSPASRLCRLYSQVFPEFLYKDRVLLLICGNNNSSHQYIQPPDDAHFGCPLW